MKYLQDNKDNSTHFCCKVFDPIHIKLYDKLRMKIHKSLYRQIDRVLCSLLDTHFVIYNDDI